MNIPSPRPARRARIEIIPLIDIIFFLLATFVLVSLSMIKNRGIQVNLPGSQTATAQDIADISTISITAEGLLFLDKMPMSPEDLPDRLANLKAEQNEAARVSIAGDADARLGPIMQILDACRKLGIKVVFQTS
jgi:biopolymer transport protein ExbD